MMASSGVAAAWQQRMYGAEPLQGRPRLVLQPQRIRAPPWARSPEGWSSKPMPWPPQALPGMAVGPAPWFEDAAYQAHLDAVTRAPATSGNWTQLLIDGAAAFARKEAEIRRADVILLKIYQFDDDASGQRIVRELADAAARGAQVYVQYGLKAFYGAWDMARFKLGLKNSVVPVLEPLLNCPNVRMVPNDFPLAWHDLTLQRDHEKYLITWRRNEPVHLFMGGMNVSDAWVCGGDPEAITATGLKYRDTDIEIIGPAAECATQAFMDDMTGLHPQWATDLADTYADMARATGHVLYPPSPENAVVRFVRNAPRQRDGQYLRNMYVSLLQQVPAGETVRIENAYVLPSAQLAQAMVHAADRGVKIRLVINSHQTAEFESSLLGHAGRAFCRSLLRRTRHPENLKFFEFCGDVRAGYNCMHHKVASFGIAGPFVVGSSNLDSQSLNWNKEDGALVYDPCTRKQFDAMWKVDVHNTRVDQDGAPIVTTLPLTPEALRADSLFSRARAWCLYRLAGYFL